MRSEATFGNTHPATRSTLVPMVLLLFGLLIMQVSWVFCIRPFAGIDEFAHADRAAAVARGQWAPHPSAAVHGSGAWVSVPTDLVQAARPECEALPYTEPAECKGAPTAPGTTRIATSAGRYNPLFYSVIGSAALPFSGASALLAMRLAAVILCWLMLLLGCLATRRWARTSWPALALALCCTPVVIYSSALAAPNGLEICAGLTLWCSLLGLFAHAQRRPDGLLLVSATVSGAVLVTLRPIGPVWCALILTTTLIATPVDLTKVKRLISDRRLWLGVGAVTVATIAGLAWTLIMRTTHLSTGNIPPVPLATQLRLTAEQVPLWLLQSVAAFPYRNQPTAPLVYIAYLTLGIGLLVIAARRRQRNRRLASAILLTIVVAIVLPAASTLATFEQYATSWQGRYGMPYTVGTLLLLAWSLDRAGRPIPWRVFYPAVALFSIAQSVSLVDTLKREVASDPLHGAGSWVAPPVTLVAAVALLGAVSMLIGARCLGTRTRLNCENPGTEDDLLVHPEPAAALEARTS